MFFFCSQKNVRVRGEIHKNDLQNTSSWLSARIYFVFSYNFSYLLFTFVAGGCVQTYIYILTYLQVVTIGAGCISRLCRRVLIKVVFKLPASEHRPSNELDSRVGESIIKF